MSDEAGRPPGPVGAGQVQLFRLLFFALIALELWLEIVHASRYGAGDFNVSHLPWLDAWLPIPDRLVVVALRLVGLWLAGRIALGFGRRVDNALLALVYGGTYLWSQLDSYQHHYLIALLLVLLIPVRWSASAPLWPLQLVRVQVGIVYFWAAIAKLHPLWLDGTILGRLVPRESRELAHGLAAQLGASPDQLWQLLAISVFAIEAFLAVAVWVPRLRLLALVPGIALHVGIEWTGFKIGLFSWYMLVFYILLLPPGWLDRVLLPDWLRIRAPAVPPALAVALGALAIWLVPVEGAALAAFAVALLFLDGEARAGAATSGSWRAAGHVLICAAPLVLHAQTDVVLDHYRYLGGDSRRRADLPGAIAAYERVVQLEPLDTVRQVRLAELYARSGDEERAQGAWTRALALEPQDPQVLSAIASGLHQLGAGEQALIAAEEALRRDPTDDRARHIRDAWRSATP